jgi:hypothetical protein
VTKRFGAVTASCSSEHACGRLKNHEMTPGVYNEKVYFAYVDMDILHIIHTWNSQ